MSQSLPRCVADAHRVPPRAIFKCFGRQEALKTFNIKKGYKKHNILNFPRHPSLGPASNPIPCLHQQDIE